MHSIPCLVSTYVVCERLSVMHKQARLPEIFDQILQNTPVLEFGSITPPSPELIFLLSPNLTLPRTPPTRNENSNFLSCAQI